MVCRCGVWEPVDPTIETEPGVLEESDAYGESHRVETGCPQCGSTDRSIWILKDALPAIRNRWEQEVRERLLNRETVEVVAQEDFGHSPMAMGALWENLTNDQRRGYRIKASEALEAAAKSIFGEAEPVERKTDA